MADNSLVFAIGAELSNLQRGAAEAKTILGGMEGWTGGLSQKLEIVGNQMISLGTRIDASIGQSLRGFGKTAINEFGSFELAMRQATSLLGTEGAKVFDDLSEKTLQLAKDLGVDAVGAAEGLYEAISAGVPPDNVLTFMEVASKSAIAGVTDTKVAVDGLSTVMNAFRNQNVEVKDAADAMFQTVNVGKVTFEQLASSLAIASPLAAAIGVNFKEMLAAGATLTTQGFSISEAFTSINSAMTALISPNKQMKELLASIGVESGKALIQAKGLEGAFNELTRAAKGNETVLAEALGRTEALKGVLGLTGDNAKIAAEHLDKITNSAGSMNEVFGQVETTSKRTMDHLKADIQALQISMGDRMGDMPQIDNGYFLAVQENFTHIEHIELLSEEYFALKRELARMRGFEVEDKDESPERIGQLKTSEVRPQPRAKNRKRRSISRKAA